MSVRRRSGSVFEAVKERHRMLVVAGLTSNALGIAMAAYVAYEWFVRSISHEVIAVVAAGAFLLGVQLLVLASLTSMLVSLHQELLARVDEDDAA